MPYIKDSISCVIQGKLYYPKLERGTNSIVKYFEYQILLIDY